MTPLVSVFRDKYARGWPRHEHGDPACVLPLGPALALAYSTDAHFVAYHAPIGRRLVREALDRGVAVELTCIVFDVDCAETHGTSTPAPEAWRSELRTKIHELAAVHPDPYFYETKGGGRIVYAQAESTVLTTQPDAITWRMHYAIAVAHLARVFGIVADPACADWQRHYRLPRATRDRGETPEKWPKRGDPHNIGSLLLDATEADVAAARRQSKAFSARQILNFKPSECGGDGLLYHLLRAHNSLIREHGRGAFVVRCPCEREHTTGSTGDGSTLLYLPAHGHEIGAIHCLHGHCSGRTVRDWLGCFSDSELNAARAAAGLAQRRVA